MQIGIGKEGNTGLCLLGTMLCLSLSVPSALAETRDKGALQENVKAASTAQDWTQILRHDELREISQITWKRTIKFFPKKGVDVARYTSLAGAKARQSGAAVATVKKEEKEASRLAKLEAKGSIQTARLEVLHQYPRTRCVIREQAPIPVGMTSTSKIYSMVWDSFDGKKSIMVEAINKETPDRGRITTESQSVLSRSLPSVGHRIFLAASPLSKYFDASNVVNARGDEIILSKHARAGTPTQSRIRIDKRTWSPVEMDEYAADGRLLVRYKAYGIQEIATNIFVPSRVVISFFGRKGILAEHEHKLIAAKFNKLADAKLIESVVPRGAIMIDARFGEGVRYRLTSGQVPSDSKVQSLLNEQKVAAGPSKAQLEDNASVDSNRSSKIIGIVGGLLLCCGIGLWYRTRRTMA
jgi:hypothetical protein